MVFKFVAFGTLVNHKRYVEVLVVVVVFIHYKLK